MLGMEEIYPLIVESFEKEYHFSFPVNGTSMQPLLHTGDIVTIEKCKDIHRGDIILYRRENGHFVLHRVYRIKESIWFVGDHQTKIEKGIKKEMCIGKVLSYQKKGRSKVYTCNRVKYRFYCWWVRFHLIRYIFSKLL